MMENWSEGKGPPFSVQTTALKAGTPDRAAMTWGTYGGHAGVWRLLKILDENKVPATFCANAHALELAPEAARQIIRSGPEVAAHCYLQDHLLADMTPEEERVAIRRSAAIVTSVTGHAPKGWLSSVLASSEHTERFVAEEGFLWSGDYNHIDQPCCVTVATGGGDQERASPMPHSSTNPSGSWTASLSDSEAELSRSCHLER